MPVYTRAIGAIIASTWMAASACAADLTVGVELGRADDVLETPRHPYTRGLLDSVPTATASGQRLRQISGSTPSLLTIGAGWAFRQRCERAAAPCEAMPTITEADHHQWRCYFPLQQHEVHEHVA